LRVTETVDAGTTKLGPADALKLVGTVDKLVAARGKSVVTFDLKSDRPADDALLAHLIGPTGNLRAPTARVGKTLLVGFHGRRLRPSPRRLSGRSYNGRYGLAPPRRLRPAPRPPARVPWPSSAT
jgi:hypothetical protein